MQEDRAVASQTTPFGLTRSARVANTSRLRCSSSSSSRINIFAAPAQRRAVLAKSTGQSPRSSRVTVFNSLRMASTDGGNEASAKGV